MPVRGIRGATAVKEDTSTAVLAATRELLEAIVTANRLNIDDVASVIFTVTPDLKSEYPARAARLLGWTNVAAIGATEMDVAAGLKRCVRVLLHVNTETPPSQIKHIYLHQARTLRPDR
ncbi:MAG: chorismate mutase [Gemmatimonadetes bacterium]|nr:chorismate mutase [Gemmatimonadota bacterium]